MLKNQTDKWSQDNDGQWWYTFGTKNVRTRGNIGKCDYCSDDYLLLPQGKRHPTKHGKFCSKKCAGLFIQPIFIKTRTGANHNHWKGGRNLLARGYVEIYRPDHPYARGGKYILEHRLVMESILGRYLESWEQIHHKNGVKHDNRPENLELWGHSHPSGQRLGEGILHCATCTCSGRT